MTSESVASCPFTNRGVSEGTMTVIEDIVSVWEVYIDGIVTLMSWSGSRGARKEALNSTDASLL